MSNSPSIMTADSEQMVASLSESLAPVAVSPEAILRMRQRIRSQIPKMRAPAGTNTYRAGGDQWVDGLSGVQLKFLRIDEAAGTQEVLVRFEPGAVVPAHTHTKEEQMIIIEGTVLVGEHRLNAGDMHVAQALSKHDELSSPDGALLLLRCEHPFPVDR